MKETLIVLLSGIVFGIALNELAFGASPEELGATIKRLEQRLDEQDKKIAEQNKTIEKLKVKLNGCDKDEVSREEVKSIIKEMKEDAESCSLPSWLENFSVFGDLRLRYELKKSGSDDRNRGRFRLRVGANKTWLEEQLEVGFGLASGEEDSINSENQTFDNSFNLKELSINRAYAKYSPNELKGLTVIGGKMANPFFHTDMLWDSSINPEGVWAVYTCQNTGPVRPFVGAGFFVVEEFSNAGDAELHAYELGTSMEFIDGIKWTTAATYYDFGNYEKPGAFQSAGNNTILGDDPNTQRLLAEEFNVINLTNKVSWIAFDLPMNSYLDLARNCGNEDGDMDKALTVGFTVGENKKKGDWSVGFKYTYIEANAMPGVFPDTDMGGTDRQGTKWCVKYNLMDSVTAGMSLFCTEPIDNVSDHSEFITRGELLWNF